MEPDRGVVESKQEQNLQLNFAGEGNGTQMGAATGRTSRIDGWRYEHAFALVWLRFGYRYSWPILAGFESRRDSTRNCFRMSNRRAFGGQRSCSKKLNTRRYLVA